ncbi:MAG TPA: zinc ribbon domain-containing protein [Nitrososphaeraceae archaeon]|nr:zinc ribbon domain-containing protein [Nitrososphaeraceae archaeon]
MKGFIDTSLIIILKSNTNNYKQENINISRDITSDIVLESSIRKIIHRYDGKRFDKRLLKWIAISIGIGIVIGFLLPIVISLAVVIGILILRLKFLRKSRRNKVMTLSNNKLLDTGTFDLISSILSSGFRSSSINKNYYCASCGTKHKETACPSCGSKFKKIIGS